VSDDALDPGTEAGHIVVEGLLLVQFGGSRSLLVDRGGLLALTGVVSGARVVASRGLVSGRAGWRAVVS
jgi:hypothetical protein